MSMDLNVPTMPTRCELTPIGRVVESVLKFIYYVDKFDLKRLFIRKANPMSDMDKKKVQAVRKAESLGHSMNDWRDWISMPNRSSACCKLCGRTTVVGVGSPTIPGNGIQGEAVVNKCTMKWVEE